MGHLRGNGHPRGQPFPSAGVRMGWVKYNQAGQWPAYLYF
jgi:hypothetical protein